MQKNMTEGKPLPLILAFFLHLRCSCVFHPVLATLFVYRYSVQGIGYASATLVGGVGELVIRSVIGIFLIPIFGFWAVCFASQSAWVVAAVAVIVQYFIYMKKIERNSGKA